MSSSSTEPRGASAGSLVDVTMPQMGVSVAEGTIVAWRAGVGDPIAAEETIVEISTDKIDTEVPAPVTGVVAEILIGPEETVAVGTVLARIAPGGAPEDRGAAVAAEPAPSAAQAGDPAPSAAPPDDPAPSTALAGEPAPSAAPPQRNGSRRYSPVVRRIAAEHGLDLTRVAGTGRGGRVRKQDVMALIGGPAGPAAGEEPPLHIESPYRPEPAGGPTTAGAPGHLSRMRRQIGEHMKRSLDTAAHCTTWIEVDMSAVEEARRRLGVTALAFVARAAIDSLRAHPALNAWLEGERYRQHAGVNLGIAVSLGEEGLIVPVIHDAQELSVEGLADRIRDLARRARERQLTPDDVRDGTFTITNPGQYGSIMATPIINQPQVAILDLEAIVKRPVVVTDARGTDAIAIRAMTILGLSWDHRALDGALAAQFLADLKRRLEAVVP